MTTPEEIVAWIRAKHETVADGCKSSCYHQTITYDTDVYYDTTWTCTFGGYCFGDLRRESEVSAPTIDELFVKVKEAIEKAIAKEATEA